MILDSYIVCFLLIIFSLIVFFQVVHHGGQFDIQSDIYIYGDLRSDGNISFS